MKTNNALYIAAKLTALLLLVAIILPPFAIVNPGERGVLIQFGQVQERVLGEGIHLITPVVNTVKKLSVRVQKQEIEADASSKDLQDVFIDVAINWHIIPETANIIFQQVGDTTEIVERIINPAVEEVLKAVAANYTAEEIITKRREVKKGVDDLLIARLGSYHIWIDDISLVDVDFSQRFNQAVEAKQIAEQEAKRADFVALKAFKDAETKVTLAKGEAEAHRVLQQTLTPEILQKQALEKWNGNLPWLVGKSGVNFLDLMEFVKDNKTK